MHNEIKVITNNQWRDIINGFDLSDKEKADFDYCDDVNSEQFIRYKGHVYHMGDIMRIESKDCSPSAFDGYHGYVGESYFSGVLFELSDCGEMAIVASYYS